MSAWDHLPNAKLIDQVLADFKAHIDVFDRAWDASSRSTVVADDTAWHRIRDVGIREAWLDIAREFDDIKHAGRSSGGGTAFRVAMYIVTALIAYDDSHKYLNMTYNELKVWGELSENSAAILLLPYIWIREELATNHSS